jgi:hypothetical protein
MKQGKSAQIKKMRHIKSKAKINLKESVIPEFNYNEFAGFLRARYYLTHTHTKYATGNHLK